MAEKQILIHPDSTLRRVSAEVVRIDSEILRLIDDMRDTLGDSDTPGIGLAAVQIGVLERVILADVEGDKPCGGIIEMINPKIVSACGEVTFEEGCLSMPDVWMPVTRSREIIVSYQDRTGGERDIKLTEYCASVVQHEVDHLNGRLIIDYLSPLRRRMAEKKLSKIKRRM